MGGIIQEVFTDSLNDTALLLPFLFLTYLLMEWMEHHTENKMLAFLKKHHRLGPFLGSIFGVVPECGFSSAASSLYASGIISSGTLIAVYLSTSDEFLPLAISNHASIFQILSILAVKVISALLFGYLAEYLLLKFPKEHSTQHHYEIEEEEDTIFRCALRHTIKIALWLFVVTFLINILVHLIGLENISTFVQNHPRISILTCTLVGIIPSCASSIVLTTLYLNKVISFAAVCAGLCSNAGAGLLVLLRVHKDIKDNIRVLSYLLLSSLMTGILLEVLF